MSEHKKKMYELKEVYEKSLASYKNQEAKAKKSVDDEIKKVHEANAKLKELEKKISSKDKYLMEAVNQGIRLEKKLSELKDRVKAEENAFGEIKDQCIALTEKTDKECKEKLVFLKEQEKVSLEAYKKSVESAEKQEILIAKAGNEQEKLRDLLEDLKKQREWLSEREKDIQNEKNVLIKEQKDLKTKKNELSTQKETLDQKEHMLKKREETLEKRSEDLKVIEKDQDDKSVELDYRELEIKKLSDRVQSLIKINKLKV